MCTETKCKINVHNGIKTIMIYRTSYQAVLPNGTVCGHMHKSKASANRCLVKLQKGERVLHSDYDAQYQYAAGYRD